MKILANQDAKLQRKFLKFILKLPPEQFIGVTTILGVKLAEKEEEKNLDTEGFKEKNDLGAQDVEQENREEENSKSNEDLSTLSAPDSKKNSEEDGEELIERKDEAKDALSILTECLEKFDALSLQKKKTLLKIIKESI